MFDSYILTIRVLNWYSSLLVKYFLANLISHGDINEISEVLFLASIFIGIYFDANSLITMGT